MAEQAPILNFSVMAGGINSLVGQVISINLKAGSYYGVEDTDIWLTPTRYWATVPEGLNEDAYDQIQKGLETGRVVLGKVFIPPVDKPAGVIDEYWAVVKSNGIGEKTKAKFREIALRKNWIDRNYTFMEITLDCIKREQGSKHRSEVLAWLNMVLDQCEGPLRVYEPPDDAEGIKTITMTDDGSNEMVMETKDEDGNPVEPSTPKPPRSHIGGDQTTSEALGNILD